MLPWWFWVALGVMLACLLGVIILCTPDKWPRNRRGK